MKSIQPYLFFNGSCREVMEFYAEVMGCELFKMAYSDVPGTQDTSTRLIHATVRRGDTALLMAADVPEGTPFHAGDNVHLTVDCDSAEEQDKLLAGLSQGGTINFALQETFWGARFCMLVDRFGTFWMLSYTLPAK